MNANAGLEDRKVGLFAANTSAPVPLEGVKVHAEIVGHASRVTMTQRFRNVERVPIDAVYIFPVPEAAAVCGLAMKIGERRIEAEVEEREKAFARYDDALAEGHGAALLDAERPNVFTVSVGNVLAGQEIVIEVTWVAELPMEAQSIRFMLPTTVAPRYAPAEDLAGISPTPAERVTPPIRLDVPYGLRLDVDVALPCPVRAIDSPSHPVRVELDGPRAHVTLSHGEAAMDRDFVLLVTPHESGRPQVLVERNEDGLVTAAVSLVPRLPAGTSAREIVFLVDRSGSMGGSSIEQVRAALQLCLRSQREGDLFNIVGFGSTFDALFERSAAYGQATLDEASRHVDAMDADMGGTEILPALRWVLEHGVPEGVGRQLVVLTDGEVTNEAAVIELARSHASDARIFTFGIGFGASEHLVRSLARVTMGEAEFIHPGERIEPKVLRQFGRLRTPSLRGVKVEWHGAEVDLSAPRTPPGIFNGEAGIAYARFRPGGNVSVTLSGTAEGTPVGWSAEVRPADAEAGTLLATLAARAAIRDLEEGTSALHERIRGSAQSGRREDRVGKEIVALARRYRLASSRTSFVAIERREAVGDQPAAELRRVPAMLTRGWGASDRPQRTTQTLQSAFLADAVCCASARAPEAPLGRTLASLGDGVPFLSPAPPSVPASRRGRPRFLESNAEPPGGHLALARLQRADGSWELDNGLCAVLGVERDALDAIVKILGRGREARAVVATLAALRFLEVRAADARDEWRLLAEKAECWLEAALTRAAATRESLEAGLASLI